MTSFPSVEISSHGLILSINHFCLYPWQKQSVRCWMGSMSRRTLSNDSKYIALSVLSVITRHPSSFWTSLSNYWLSLPLCRECSIYTYLIFLPVRQYAILSHIVNCYITVVNQSPYYVGVLFVINQHVRSLGLKFNYFIMLDCVEI